MKVATSLLIASLVLSATATRVPRHIQRRCPDQYVFGLDLGMTSITCAASFPDNSVKAVASTQPDEEYKALMKHWHDICTKQGADQDSIRVAIEQDYPYLSRLKDFDVETNKWRKDSCRNDTDYLAKTHPRYRFEEDAATATLAETLTQIREKCFAALNLDTDLDPPYAEIALPGWMFGRLPAYSDDYGKDSPPEANDTIVTSTVYQAMYKRIYTAVERAGFRASPKGQVRGAYHWGTRFGGPQAAPSAVLLRELFKGKGGVGLVVHREDMGDQSYIGVWAERDTAIRMDGTFFFDAQCVYQSVPQDSRDVALIEVITSGVKQVLVDTKPPKKHQKGEDHVSMILTGPWPENKRNRTETALRESGQQIEIISLRSNSSAAMRVADEARIDCLTSDEEALLLSCSVSHADIWGCLEKMYSWGKQEL